MSGLIGVPLAPLLHTGLWHAASNTLPLLVLGGLMLIAGSVRFWTITTGIVLLGGFLVWLFARNAPHVGASGLVFGYFGALLARAYFERSLLAIAIAIACATMILYGGILCARDRRTGARHRARARNHAAAPTSDQAR